jgi:hypothetical protein
MPLSDMERILLVLHEYDSLRHEIIERSGFMFQMIDMIILILCVLIVWPINRVFTDVTTTPNYRHRLIFLSCRWLAAIILACILSVSMFGFYRDIEKSAARVREIDTYVNGLAGEDLLQWETRWGGSPTGYWGWGRKLPSAAEAPPAPSERQPR